MSTRLGSRQSPTVLVVDDEDPIRNLLTTALASEGLTPTAAGTLAEASALIARHAYDLILLDVRLGRDDGLTLLRQAGERDAGACVVVITGYGTVENAVQAMRLGAVDYLIKPFELTELTATVNRVLERRRIAAEDCELYADLARSYRIEGVVGRSPEIRDVYRIATIVAPTDATVLITGETGTGKELVARSVHLQSRRSAGPFVVMNCGAIPETLLETEVFGCEKGAFTGALAARPGRFERAEGGTVFLDEIGDMSLGMQVKILRVLQDRVVERVGSVRPKKVDFRIVAATNKDLVQAMRSGQFREDLYYRISVVTLDLPPLRRRTEDIPLLVQHFVDKYRKQFGKAIRGVSPMGMKKLLRHPWPGNIRELEYCIKRSVLLAGGEIISAEDIRLDERPGALAREGTGRIPAG